VCSRAPRRSDPLRRRRSYSAVDEVLCAARQSMQQPRSALVQMPRVMQLFSCFHVLVQRWRRREPARAATWSTAPCQVE